MKNIMTRAWEIARTGAEKFGGKAKDYFAHALKMAWAEYKDILQQYDVYCERYSEYAAGGKAKDTLEEFIEGRLYFIREQEAKEMAARKLVPDALRKSGSDAIISQLITLGKEYRQYEGKAYMCIHRRNENDDIDTIGAQIYNEKRRAVGTLMEAYAGALIESFKLDPEKSYEVHVDGHYDTRTSAGKPFRMASLFWRNRYSPESKITFQPFTRKAPSFIKVLVDGEKEAERYANA